MVMFAIKNSMLNCEKLTKIICEKLLVVLFQNPLERLPFVKKLVLFQNPLVRFPLVNFGSVEKLEYFEVLLLAHFVVIRLWIDPAVNVGLIQNILTQNIFNLDASI